MKLHTLFFLATLPAFGQFSITPPIIHDIEAGTQQAQQLAPITLQQGGGAAYRVRLKSGGRWLPLTGLIARLDVRSSASSTEAILISGTPITNATPHYFAISITSAHTGTPLDGWRYAVIIEQGGEDYVLGEGRIDILPTAWAGAGTTPVAVAFDWSRYPAFANTLTDGAYIFGTGLTTTEGVDGRVTVDADAAQPSDTAATPGTLALRDENGATAFTAVTDLCHLQFDCNTTVPAAGANEVILYATDGDTPALWVRTAARDFNALLDTVGFARNTTGAAIPALTPVRFSGNQGMSPFPLIEPCDPTDAEKMPAIAVTINQINHNNNGAIQLFGRVDKVDTSAFSEGDRLYVGNGVLSDTPPETGIVQFMGVVLISHATNGRIALTPEVLVGITTDETLTGVGFVGDPLQVASNIVAGAAAGATALQAESDTLATVTARGGATTEPMTIGTRGAGAVGTSSFAQGLNVVASGNYSHAQGTETAASGNNSYAQGFHTTASGITSHAQGNNTTASGDASHAQGNNTTASGMDSHAQGATTTASGDASHAQGIFTVASGFLSHAAGLRATASHAGSWAWQGTAGAFDEPVYTSHGNGTFNIAPVGGLAGFYISGTPLSATLAGKAATNHTHVIGDVTGLQAAVDSIIPPMYAPRQAVGYALTNTIALDKSKVIYTVAATNDTTLAFDFSAVDLTANVARWETWIDVASTNVSVALPGTNVVQYLEAPDLSTTVEPQTLQVAWQAWAVGGATNIQAHVYARNPEDE